MGGRGPDFARAHPRRCTCNGLCSYLTWKVRGRRRYATGPNHTGAQNAWLFGRAISPIAGFR